jgi:hypothetical protein
MGWFTGKQDSPPMREDQGTISDAEWRKIQTRAARANPDRASWTSPDAAKHRRAASEQYRKRGQS